MKKLVVVLLSCLAAHSVGAATVVTVTPAACQYRALSLYAEGRDDRFIAILAAVQADRAGEPSAKACDKYTSEGYDYGVKHNKLIQAGAPIAKEEQSINNAYVKFGRQIALSILKNAGY